MNKKKIIVGILGFFGLLLMLNFALFFGLQVSTTLGNISLIATGLCAIGYVYYLVK